MAVTLAEAWAFQFSAESIQNIMEFQGGDLFSVAYSIFDENIVDRGATGSRLYLSNPMDEKPAVFVEKAGSGYDLVLTWHGEEKHRGDLGEQFYADARRYLG